MKRIIPVIICIVLAVSLCSCSGQSNKLSFGTGDIGGRYYSFGNALSKVIEKDDENLTLTIKTTAGSAANLRLLQKGFLNFAIVQSDILSDAYSGKGSFEGNKCDGVRVIAGLYTEECQIVTLKDSGINTVSDMFGKKVSVGEKESGVMQNAEQILFANGLSFDSVNAQYLSFTESAAKLKSGEIDAFFCTAGAPTNAVSELSKDTEIKVISLDEKTISRLTAEHPFYSECIIPAGTYNGQSEDIKTVGVKAVLVTSNKVTNKTVSTIINALFNHSEELQYSTGVKPADAHFAATSIPAPFHSGVSEWYSNKGIDVKTSDSGDTDFGIAAAQD